MRVITIRIDHVEKYVDGQIHTNGRENVWSLLKRAIKGTYVSVEPFQLFRYLDEQAYRLNHRNVSDAERFRGVLAHTTGRRLTYAELIATANAVRERRDLPGGARNRKRGK